MREREDIEMENFRPRFHFRRRLASSAVSSRPGGLTGAVR